MGQTSNRGNGHGSTRHYNKLVSQGLKGGWGADLFSTKAHLACIGRLHNLIIQVLPKPHCGAAGVGAGLVPLHSSMMVWVTC